MNQRSWRGEAGTAQAMMGWYPTLTYMKELSCKITPLNVSTRPNEFVHQAMLKGKSMLNEESYAIMYNHYRVTKTPSISSLIAVSSQSTCKLYAFNTILSLLLVRIRWYICAKVSIFITGESFPV